MSTVERTEPPGSRGAGLDEQMDADWRAFRARLADGLAGLADGGLALIRPAEEMVVDGDSLWTSVRRHRRELLVTIPSNTYLPDTLRLSAPAMRTLREMGLRRRHGSADYEIVLPLSHVDQAAAIICGALRDCYAVLHPTWLEVTGVDGCTSAAPVEVSPLPLAVLAEDHDHLRRLLDDTVGRVTEPPHRASDDEYMFWTEAAVVMVSLHPESPVVVLRSMALRGVEHRRAARVAVNELNRERRGVTFMLERGNIVTEMHVLAAPFSAQNVVFALHQMIRVTQEAAQRLRPTVGGESYASIADDARSRTEVLARSLVTMLADGPVSIRQVAGVCDQDPDLISDLIDYVVDGQADWQGLEPHADRALRLLRRALRLVQTE